VRLTNSLSYRWIVLAVAYLGAFCAIGFGRFGYSAILPSMQEGLGIDSAAAGSLASWNLAGYTVMAAAGGLLASRLGTRKVVTAGLALTAAGMLLTGLADGLTAASAGRLVTGLGNGMVLVPSITLMAAWFDVRRLGLASSTVSTGASLALVLVGLAIPRIIAGGETDGWRAAWYFFAGITACLALLTGIFQRDHPREVAASLAGAGSSTPVPRQAPTPAKGLYSGLKTIARSRYAWHIGLVYLLYGVAFPMYLTFFQKRLTSDLGLSGELAGYLFLGLGVGGVLGGGLWGAVSDRIGRGRTLALMCLVQAVAALVFACGSVTPALAFSAVIFGLAGMGVPGVIGAGCGDQFGAVLASSALGFVTIFMGVGQIVGPYVGGELADVSGSLSYSYLLAAGLFCAGALSAAFLEETGWARRKRARL